MEMYTWLQCDPFSKVISLLSRELKVSGDNHILLSHKTATISPTTSPASLGITTADIIGQLFRRTSLQGQLNCTRWRLLCRPLRSVQPPQGITTCTVIRNPGLVLWLEMKINHALWSAYFFLADAVVMPGSIDSSLNDSQSSTSGLGEHITIKVQTSNKNMKYSLAKVHHFGPGLFWSIVEPLIKDLSR